MDKQTFITRYTRKFVCDHLYFSGIHRTLLTDAQQWRAYCLADGFGLCSESELAKINEGWDWSHIRDSSEGAFTRMAEYIIKAAGWDYSDIQTAAIAVYNAFEQGGLDHELAFKA